MKENHCRGVNEDSSRSSTEMVFHLFPQEMLVQYLKLYNKIILHHLISADVFFRKRQGMEIKIMH
jgi:hypothetical protein